MSEESPLTRQWILLRTLAARKYGVTVKELAHELGTSDKTVRRDLKTFQVAGFPLREIVGDFGRKRWHLETRPPAELTFTWEEAAALYLGRRLLEPLVGTMFWQASREALKKIRAMLETVPLDYLDKFATMFCQTTVGMHDYAAKADLIDALMQATEDCRVVSMAYHALRATEPVTYAIHPYGLAYHRGALYLIGRSVRHHEVRHWKVDRIEGVDPTSKKFERPADFDLQQHLAKSFGVFQGDGDARVTVRFLPAVARYIEESVWHPSQKLSRQRDGSVLAEFQLDGVEEIKRWIMSFGKQARVVEPASLREAIVAEFQEVVAASGIDGSPAGDFHANQLRAPRRRVDGRKRSSA